MPKTTDLAALWQKPRRRPDDDPGHEARQRHIRAVALHASGHWSEGQIAAMEGITPRTLYHWKTKVLREYTDPEAVGLRRLLGHDPSPAAG